MKNEMALVWGATLMAGCTTVGNPQIADKDTVAKIIPGKSTAADVRTLLGEPSKKTFSDNGEETWEYVLRTIDLIIGGAEIETDTLTVRFRSDNVVRNVGSGKTASQ